MEAENSKLQTKLDKCEASRKKLRDKYEAQWRKGLWICGKAEMCTRCTTGCSSNHCPCVRANERCDASCRCENCRSKFNNSIEDRIERMGRLLAKVRMIDGVVHEDDSSWLPTATGNSRLTSAVALYLARRMCNPSTGSLTYKENEELIHCLLSDKAFVGRCGEVQPMAGMERQVRIYFIAGTEAALRNELSNESADEENLLNQLCRLVKFLVKNDLWDKSDSTRWKKQRTKVVDVFAELPGPVDGSDGRRDELDDKIDAIIAAQGRTGT